MSQLLRLADIMARLRVECPWDAEQTHRSLAKHLIEETAEVVEAIEAGSTDTDIPDDDLREELGDLLLQIYFHAEIASSQHRFDIEDVARGICDKLVRRHPWVFEGADDPEDMMGTWEAVKQAEKQRASALDGIPETLSTLAGPARWWPVPGTCTSMFRWPTNRSPPSSWAPRCSASSSVRRPAASTRPGHPDALRVLERAVLTAEATSEEAC